MLVTVIVIPGVQVGGAAMPTECLDMVKFSRSLVIQPLLQATGSSVLCL